MGYRQSTQQHLYKELLVGDSPYTVLDGDPDYFFLNTTGGDITVVLPTIADNIGRVLHFLKTSGSNIATLDGEGIELIDAEADHNLYRHRRYVEITPRTSGTTEWTIIVGGPKGMCHHVDVTIPKKPLANPPDDEDIDGFPTLDFDKATDESIFIHYELPANYYHGGAIAIELTWLVDTAPVGVESVVWGLQYKQEVNGDNFNFGVGTTVVTDTEVVTAGTPANDKKRHRTTFSLVTTGWIPHGYLLVRLYRDADAVADDFDDDVRLVSVNFNIQSVRVPGSI